MCDETEAQLFRYQKALPRGLKPYKTNSIFYVGGVGPVVIDRDATEPARDDVWLPLSFEHDQTDDHSSYLTIVREQPTLYCHRTGHAWVNMPFSDAYYGNSLTCEPYRLLKGDLPTFLALLAFSCLRTSCDSIFLHCHIVASGKYTT